MADKKVQFNVVVGGIPEIKGALKGVTESARDMNLKVQQMAERTAQRITELERNKLAAIKRVNESIVNDEANKTRRLLEIESRFNSQVTNLKEREALKVKHLNENAIRDMARNQSFNGFNFNAVSNAAQAGGFFRAGHAIRMAGQLGISSQAGVAIAGVGAALGGLYVAGKLVEVGFESLAFQAKNLATAFLGAISQIGGAKNLQEMLVEAAAKEKGTAATRFTVSPEERLSTQQLDSLVNSLAKRPELGAFTSTQWMETLKNVGTLTGKQRSLPPDLLELMGKMAHIGNVPIEQMGDIVGRIMAANKTATPDQIKDIFLAAHAIGQSGSFSIGEIPQSIDLIKGGGMLAGNTLENTKKAFAIGTILRPRAGGLEQAGVEFNSFIEQTMRAHAQGEFLPGVQFNKQGAITNIEQAIANAVATPAQNRPAPYRRAETAQFLSNTARQAGVEDVDTADQIKSKVLSLIYSYEKLHTSMEEFNAENQDSVTTQDVLKAQFNDLADQLEIALLPILKELVPDVKAFADALIRNKDNISEAMKLMIQAFFNMIPAALFTTKAVIYMGEIFGYTIKALTFLLDSMTGGTFHDQLSKIDDSAGKLIDSQSKLIPIIDQLGKSFEDLQKNVSGASGNETGNNRARDLAFHKTHPDFIGPPQAGQLTNDALLAAAADLKRAAESHDTATSNLKIATDRLERVSDNFLKQPVN